ncbi:Uma2 family endonuclease [Amphibiibacter pelophylacis]|uniref:Uma2 family endonuclease n=1 Tax=Amphibiibacter pelophylacis TaxID=1799477 RepID=A0ACC6P134_9BURK
MGVPLKRMTVDAFLVWEESQLGRHEFYRGEIFAMVGATARHNRVILNLAGRIADHLDTGPYQVFAESMKVRVAEGILYPDVVVACDKAQAGDEQVIASPRLIIEVLSPSTRGYDKRDKFALYRSLSSLTEYALIDPSNFSVEVFTRTGQDAWAFVDQTAAQALTLCSIDLEIPLDQGFRGVQRAD